MKPTRSSDELAQRITTTVNDWVIGQGGGMLRAFTAIVTYYDEDGDSCIATAHADGQTPEQTLGLLHIDRIAAEHSILDLLTEDE